MFQAVISLSKPIGVRTQSRIDGMHTRPIYASKSFIAKENV
jgi:hypothetical protein